ncbi:hypothetical protein HLH44_03760 [Gluconacetobacter sp. 1c LMG 22058]|uniref:Uncharacterized protein n=1 Tax=Gluconacetobacter dulcium TaxID=2729096 RepID=A0A7W4JXM2_9PROT|nr:hypothetical protein [Gluconacetobacter dulcium]MBB2196588.1 hypothetical protein [Gluconacetobacter dulcium]
MIKRLFSSVFYLSFFVYFPCAQSQTLAGKLCSIYKESSIKIIPVEKIYYDARNSDDPNELRNTLKRDSAFEMLKDEFERRNNELYPLLGGKSRQIRDIDIIAEKVDIDEEDVDGEIKRVASVVGHLDCDKYIAVSFDKIVLNKSNIDQIIKIDRGMKVSFATATVASHDEPLQRPADAVQWGGPINQIFGGFRADAFDSPRLKLLPENSRSQQ